MKKINALQGLRFINAVFIVLCHIPFKNISLKEIFSGGGYAGVIFFFLISGFGLTYSDGDKQQYAGSYSLKQSFIFAWKRMKKIYKWYILIILITLPVQFYNLTNWHNRQFALAGTVLTLIATPTMLQSLFGIAQASHLGVDSFWFVSTLFIIYIIYPIIGKINYKIKQGGLKRVLVAITICFISYGLFYKGFAWLEKVSIFNDLCYGSPYINVFIFVMGVLVCDLYWMISSRVNLVFNSAIEVLVLVLIFMWVWGKGVIFGFDYNLIWILGCIVLQTLSVLVFAFERGTVSHLLSNRVMLQGGGVQVIYSSYM